MSLKSTLTCSLIGGGLVLGVLMRTESYRLVNLENRTHETLKSLYSAEKNSPEAQRLRMAVEDQFRDLVAGWTRLKGEDSWETLNCRCDFADALFAEGKYQESAAQYRSAVNGMDHTLGWKHSQTLDTRERLVTLLERMGKYDEAEVPLRRVVQASTEMRGAPDGPIWNSLLSNLDHQEKYREELIELRTQEEMFRPLADYRHEEDLVQAKIDLVERRSAAKQALDDAKTKWGEDREETRACRERLVALRKEKPSLPKGRADDAVR